MKCSNCETPLLRDTDVFGSDDYPVCILCWLDPEPVIVEDPFGKKDIIWTTSDAEVDVPYKVATCHFCDALLTVEVSEWETGSRKPTEGGVWIHHSCSRTCRGEDNMDDGKRARIEEWAIASIRILHSVALSEKLIPGIKCPALERHREATGSKKELDESKFTEPVFGGA
jgi:hypothetical protein